MIDYPKISYSRYGDQTFVAFGPCFGFSMAEGAGEILDRLGIIASTCCGKVFTCDGEMTHCSGCRQPVPEAQPFCTCESENSIGPLTHHFARKVTASAFSANSMLLMEVLLPELDPLTLTLVAVEVERFIDASEKQSRFSVTQLDLNQLSFLRELQ